MHDFECGCQMLATHGPGRSTSTALPVSTLPVSKCMGRLLLQRHVVNQDLAPRLQVALCMPCRCMPGLASSLPAAFCCMAHLGAARLHLPMPSPTSVGSHSSKLRPLRLCRACQVGQLGPRKQAVLCSCLPEEFLVLSQRLEVSRCTSSIWML